MAATPLRRPAASLRRPGDGGLIGLALLMQLAGTMTAAMTAGLGFNAVMMSIRMSRQTRGETDAEALWLLLLVVVGLVRALLHRRAGQRLLAPGTASVFAGIQTYAVASAVHAALVCTFLLSRNLASSPVALAWGVALLAWPAALLLVARLPRFAALAGGLPATEDRGLNGASLLMVVMGSTGVGVAVLALYVGLQFPKEVLREPSTMIALVVVGLLGVRSVLHVLAGRRGLVATHLDAAVEATARYAGAALVIALVVGVMVVAALISGGVDHAGRVALLLCVVWMLLAWPLMVRRLFTDRQFADMLHGSDADAVPIVHGRARDRGLSVLGWLLVGLGVHALATTLPALMPERSDELMGGGHGFTAALAVFRLGDVGHSPWWTMVVAVLQLGAGVALVQVHPLARWVTTAYGVAAVLITGWTHRGLFTQLGDIVGVRIEALLLLPAALVVPAASVWLAHRAGRRP